LTNEKSQNLLGPKHYLSYIGQIITYWKLDIDVEENYLFEGYTEKGMLEFMDPISGLRRSVIPLLSILKIEDYESGEEINLEMKLGMLKFPIVKVLMDGPIPDLLKN